MALNSESEYKTCKCSKNVLLYSENWHRKYIPGMKQAEKLKSREIKEGWMKNDEWRMNEEWWRMKNDEGWRMMKDDDFKLLRGFDYGQNNGHLWM